MRTKLALTRIGLILWAVNSIIANMTIMNLKSGSDAANYLIIVLSAVVILLTLLAMVFDSNGD